MTKSTFHIVSLGCAKNTVDSDSMAQLLTRAGYQNVKDPQQAHIIIVNTCGFISPAKEESFQTLAEISARKKNDQILVAAGCLTQRYGIDVSHRISRIDGIIGTRRWMDIVDLVKKLNDKRCPRPYCHLPEVTTVGKDEQGVLCVSVQGASAYIKIADGCRHPCAFCAIPLIKGTAISRPIESILAEARCLQEKCIHEIVLIAQDTTDYGHDLGLKNGLAHLLTQMVTAAPKVDWLRIMYAYPGYVTDELIETMATRKQIVHYLDIPLQHAHPLTLKRMRRPTNVTGVYKTIEKIRRSMPDIALRSTFIVGYPGETEEEFQTLLDFIEEIRFDRVGAFKFSFERGTASERLGDPIPNKLKEERLKRFMEKQQQISLERNKTFVGKCLDVLVEGVGQGVSIGRSYRDSPEIDGLVIVRNEIPVGQIIPILINDATPYDLIGVTKPAKK